MTVTGYTEGMTEDEAWDQVYAALNDAKGICWDGCHKIYVLMDDEQVRICRDYDYEVVPPGTIQMHDWWAEACGLRFIVAVYTDEVDPNKGYIDLIPQFAFDEDEEDDDE